MKATSISAGSARRTATRDAVVFLHGYQLERNAARAAAAEAAGTFVLVLAITSAAVAAALARPVAGTPYGSLAVPVAGGLGLAIAVASTGHISGVHFNPAVTLGLTVNRQFPWAYAPGYVLAQFAGATAAAAVTWGLYGDQARSIAHLGTTAPAAGARKHPPATPPRPAGRLITATRHHHRLLPSPQRRPAPARPASDHPAAMPTSHAPASPIQHPAPADPPHKHDTSPGSQARHITSIYVRSRLRRARHREPIRSAALRAGHGRDP